MSKDSVEEKKFDMACFNISLACATTPHTRCSLFLCGYCIWEIGAARRGFSRK